MARFLYGAFVELCQLTLVLAAALFAIDTAVGNAGAFVLLVVYGLLVWWPARDLVEGWLGMVSRRLPDRYRDRGENLGRGVMGVVFAIFWAVLWFIAAPDVSTAQGEAFDRTYALLALAIFGIGGAVPRLWFGLKAAAWTPQSALPELLRQAGRRGAIFIVAMFVGIALGFVAGYSAQVPRMDDVAPAPEPVVPVEDLRWGALCRAATKDCPSSRHVIADRVARAKPASLHVEVIPDGEPPVCTVTQLPGTFAFDVALPDGVDHCTYFIDVKPVAP